MPPYITVRCHVVLNIGPFIERLNQKTASTLVQACARRYAVTGSLRTEGSPWTDKELRTIWAETHDVTAGSFLVGIPHPPVKNDAFRRARDWLVLTQLSVRQIPLGICPVPGCQRFFVDPKRRGKSACSPEHANRHRQHIHFEKLKQNPRRYRTYLKKQRDLMRERRATGLA